MRGVDSRVCSAAVQSRLGSDAKIQLLRDVPLFAQCSKRELGQLALVTDEVDVDPETVLITEGDRGREFFVLVGGAADVRRKGRRVNTMGPGDFFGEIALLADRPRTATVTTTAPTHLLVLTDRAFRRLLKDLPSIQLKVLTALAERLPAEAF